MAAAGAGNDLEVAAHDVCLDLILVVPPGLDKQIHPWGVESLRDYVTTLGTVESARIWRLQEEPWLRELFDTCREPLYALYSALEPEARGVFFGHTVNPFLYMGLVGAVGTRFLEIAERHQMFSLASGELGLEHRVAEALTVLQEQYGRRLRDGIQQFLEPVPGAAGRRRRVWGISVYDYTLFNSLFLARAIRELDPDAAILLGGDYFDFRAADKLVRAVPWVDGVVVGYGEEVLRQVLLGLASGKSPGSLGMTGFVTRGQGAEATQTHEAADRVLGLGQTSREHRQTVVNVPSSYTAPSRTPPVRYVHLQPDGTIRILTQRGCSWGRCTFCSQLDRRMFFPIGIEHVLEELTAVLEQAEPTENGVRRVVLDADENDLNAVLPLIEHLNGFDESYVIEFWLMVRKFGVELPRLLAARNRNVLLKVILNIESLNLSTLKRMKKGTVPLQALEAVKAVQDTGHVVQSNYFMNYPLEDLQSVREEADLLRRVVHLLVPPKMMISGFSYLANARDEIHFDQEKYQIESSRVEKDVWLQEVFGVDLPFSIWAFNYRKKLRDYTAEGLVPYSYHRLSFARKELMAANTARLVLLGTHEQGALSGLAEKARHAGYFLWKGVHRVAQELAKTHAYQERTAVFEYLEGVARTNGLRRRKAAQTMDGGTPSGFADLGRRVVARWEGHQERESSRLRIEGNRLLKDYHLPGHEESWSRELDDKELRVLRFLYWRRQERQVRDRFKDELPAHELQEILDRHTALGTVLVHTQMMLCVAHDPGYWRTEECMTKGPSARTDLSPHPKHVEVSVPFKGAQLEPSSS
ncbi:B12-binding domain-containing radical SAM protein [Cystobacter fuscus]|uniref:B12-binding domain-containing radical SAM protein n=1 Tax=Cystobacter fuscus TaxID=43 RepID=UPI002B2EBF61|nr:hypothetical protein F0U63_32025 [Cystobacter fuscus]